MFCEDLPSFLYQSVTWSSPTKIFGHSNNFSPWILVQEQGAFEGMQCVMLQRDRALSLLRGTFLRATENRGQNSWRSEARSGEFKSHLKQSEHDIANNGFNLASFHLLPCISSRDMEDAHVTQEIKSENMKWIISLAGIYCTALCYLTVNIPYRRLVPCTLPYCTLLQS